MDIQLRQIDKSLDRQLCTYNDIKYIDNKVVRRIIYIGIQIEDIYVNRNLEMVKHMMRNTIWDPWVPVQFWQLHLSNHGY